jgi:hypothetical protein
MCVGGRGGYVYITSQDAEKHDAVRRTPSVATPTFAAADVTSPTQDISWRHVDSQDPKKHDAVKQTPSVKTPTISSLNRYEEHDAKAPKGKWRDCDLCIVERRDIYRPDTRYSSDERREAWYLTTKYDKNRDAETRDAWCHGAVRYAFEFHKPTGDISCCEDIKRTQRNTMLIKPTPKVAMRISREQNEEDILLDQCKILFWTPFCILRSICCYLVCHPIFSWLSSALSKK